MSHRIVTNNPLVRDSYDNVIFIEGSYEDVLIKVRDLVHAGIELIDSPLGASIRMLLSPYRSILVGTEPGHMNTDQILLIEQSILNYRTLTDRRNAEPQHEKDYAVVDKELLKASIQAYEDIRLQNYSQFTGGEFLETRA
ncbi:GrdX family protein [Acidaminobacter hydrogenoformans]|uniref:GrdX protein n=1 Tax=Acidaminobacter hydrogenoformans DSM 2784 TaxID=1120920 RepID=A0A1G5RST1_9FIRM|nr:GrdX family protein [Acidaminobacter hydrogenoformans]SCZ76481.1 hypothetical protein SAMN03080599_00261 [Acidaminobacter hydrogenoformans DSM 2784]